VTEHGSSAHDMSLYPKLWDSHRKYEVSPSVNKFETSEEHKFRQCSHNHSIFPIFCRTNLLYTGRIYSLKLISRRLLYACVFQEVLLPCHFSTKIFMPFSSLKFVQNAPFISCALIKSPLQHQAKSADRKPPIHLTFLVQILPCLSQ